MADELDGLQVDPEGTAEAEVAPDPEWKQRFGSEDKMYEAWQNAEKKISQQGNDLAKFTGLEEQLEELTALVGQQQHTPQQDPAQNPFIRAAQQALEDGDAQALMAINAQLFSEIVDQRLATQKPPEREADVETLSILAEQQVRQQYGDDYDRLRAETFAKLEQHPGLVSNASSLGEIQKGLETAFALAQRDELLTGQQTSLAQQQAAQETARQRKLEAETLTGNGSARVAAQSEQEKLWERLKTIDDGSLRLGTQ